MASAAEQLAANMNIGSFARAKELHKRLLFTLMALIVYRIGTYIPIPGINSQAFLDFFGNPDQQRGILDMFNMFSGGAVERMAVFALNVMPYISASIIVQLMGAVYGPWEKLKKEGGEAGRKQLNQYTRYLTVVLAIAQSFGIAMGLQNSQGMVDQPGMFFVLTTVVTLTGGTMFLMWLGEQITERGIGNGISIIIFAGIVAGLPHAIGGTLELARTGAFSIPLVLFLFAGAILVTAFVVFVERGQRKITVNYAKRQVGRKMFGGQTSHLPLKLNMSGVIPPIFASSIILFPATLAGWFGSSENMSWLKDIGSTLSPGQPLYILLFAASIIFFCFFYTALVFNPKETADNLKKSGAFVPGIRPGEQTAKYIDRIMARLTLAGALYITAVCLLPEFLILEFNVPFYFGGTSLLIIVVVTMDFMAQVQSHLMSHQYEGLLKKANFKGGAVTPR